MEGVPSAQLADEAHGDRATRGHWEEVYTRGPRLRLPSPWLVGTRNFQRLIGPKVTPGMQVLEIGGAPGKYLAWLAAKRGARVATIDYTEVGIAHTQRLFEALGLEGDFRCEDAFKSTFPRGAFDLTYSLGVVEHFDDPRPLVREHVELTKPGGRVVVAVPNYGAIYGTLQSYFDPDNLSLHNVRIMSAEAMRALAPDDITTEVEVFSFGRIGSGLVSWHRKLPSALARVFDYSAKAIGLIQPFDFGPLCPWLVLSMRRSNASG